MTPVRYTLCHGEEVSPDLAWLTRSERERIKGFRFEKRRQDWLLGRWAAKRLVLDVAGLPASAVGRVEIASAADGAPLPLLDGRPYPMTLSLSHSNGRALCAATREGVALGCDIERVDSRDAAFGDTFLTACERDRVAAAADGDLTTTAIWSLKESALKALRKGLSVDTRYVKVRLTGGPSNAGWAAARIDIAGGGSFDGLWATRGGFVISLAAEGDLAAPVATGVALAA